MNTLVINTTRAVRRHLAAVVIVVALALSFTAAFAALAADTNATGDGIFAWIGDYITAVGDALGGD
jgi:hypothetical protein